MSCQGLIPGFVRLQTRTKPCGIRAHIDTARPENQKLTKHPCRWHLIVAASERVSALDFRHMRRRNHNSKK